MLLGGGLRPTIVLPAVGIRAARLPRQLLAPRGFAHGYLTLSEECVVLYKTTAYYAPEAEGGLRLPGPVRRCGYRTPTRRDRPRG